jgi:hypothetical protein
MKKIMVLFFIISNSLLLYGQSTTISFVIEKSYQLKNIPSPQDIAWDGNDFWVIDNFTFNLYKLSSDFESIDTSIYLAPRDFRDLAFDGKYFWIVNNTFHQVLKINRDSLNDIKVLSLPVEEFVTGITCVNSDIYLAWFAGWSSQIAKVVPGTSSVSRITYTMGAVTGLTYNDGSFYYSVVDPGTTPSGIVAEKPPFINPVIYYLPAEIKSPTDVEIVSGDFWVLDYETKKLFKLKVDSTSSCINEPIVPNEEILNQNYPNPFNPQTTIEYSIKNWNYVTLKVYDLLGKEIVTLINEEKPAGNYNIQFDAAKYNLPSGIYFYTLKAGDYTSSKKMILIK